MSDKSSLQDAYEEGRAIHIGEAGDASVITITGRDGKEILRISGDGGIFRYGEKIGEDDHGLLAAALTNAAQEIRVPHWIWDLVCGDCRVAVSGREAVRRLRPQGLHLSELTDPEIDTAVRACAEGILATADSQHWCVYVTRLHDLLGELHGKKAVDHVEHLEWFERCGKELP